MDFLNTPEKRDRRLVHLPMGRFGEAVEVAKGALFRTCRLLSRHPAAPRPSLSSRCDFSALMDVCVCVSCYFGRAVASDDSSYMTVSGPRF